MALNLNFFQEITGNWVRMNLNNCLSSCWRHLYTASNCWSINLPQVIGTSATSQETFDSLLNFTKVLGKTPVSCKVRSAVCCHCSCCVLKMYLNAHSAASNVCLLRILQDSLWTAYLFLTYWRPSGCMREVCIPALVMLVVIVLQFVYWDDSPW